MNKRFAKIISLMLVLVMVLGVVPGSVFAGPQYNDGTNGFGDLIRNWWEIIVRPLPWYKPTPNYPAQSFGGDDLGGLVVNVEAPAGALPEGTEMYVERVYNTTNIQTAVDNSDLVNGDVIAAVDITFYHNGAEFQPGSDVKVTLSYAGFDGCDDLSVVHIGASAEEVVNEVPFVDPVEDVESDGETVSFDARDFSVYAVIGEGTAGNLLTVEFYARTSGSTGAWEKINAQAVRMSQIDVLEAPVFDPGVPSITTSQSFEGWAVENDLPITDDTVGVSIDEINEEIKASGYTASTPGKTIKYYAMVYDVRYVVYHDQAGAVLMTKAYHIHEGNATESVKIDWSYVGFKGEQNFAGWVTEDKVEVLGDYPLYAASVAPVYQNGRNYDLSTSLELYPYLNTGHWLTFNNNLEKNNTLNGFNDTTSASYTSPVFISESENTAAPATPTRTGYTFGGWFKDENLTERFIFGSPLNEDTTVYAKWVPASTTYRIAVWQQLSTDTVDSDNMNNEYAYYTPTTVEVVLTAHTGDQVTLGDAYKNLGNQNNSTTDWGEMGYYFDYNADRSDTDAVTVKGDGSTVLNVYYDRKLITIHFWTSDSMYTHANISGSGYVPAANGEYYYYENPNPTGYYLCGTGPNASTSPKYATFSGYYWGWASINSSNQHVGYSSLNGNSPATYYANTDSLAEYTSEDWPSSNNIRQSNEGYWYERYGSSSSSYSYFPLYYQYTSTSSYDTGYYPVGTGPDPTAAGTHNLITVTNPMVGLYQAPLYGWPAEPSGYEWEYDDVEDSKHYGITYRDAYDIPDNTHTTTWNIYAVSVSGTINSTIHWMCEKLDGSFEEVTTNKIKTTTTQYYDHGKFLGFYAYGHNLTTNSTSTSNGFVAYQKNVGITGEDFGSNGAYVFYIRRTYNFNYISNNDTVKTEQNVKYQQDISGFASYVPTNGHEGYYFDGWYADPGCTKEFDFNTTMPNNEVTVYAKWTMMRFRVVLDPTGGEEGVNPTDITFPGNQVTTFRVDYGELVQASSINNAQREGYTLLGWYLDKDYTEPFSFSTPVTDAIADMSYATASDADRQGTDPWNAENPTYSDVGRANVRGKVTIYAQWRQNPDGVIGINVHYDSTDKNGNTGKFSDNSTEWDDPNLYADQAKAFGQPASTPDNTDLQFLYWEILNADGEVVGKAYPGQLWTVHVDWAKVTDLTAKAVYTAKDDIKIIDNPGAGIKAPKRSGTRATETYVAVTQPTPGKKYLITYTRSAGDYAWLMSTTSFKGTSISDYGVTVNNRPNGVQVTVSNGTITGDYNDYLYGVEYYNGRYRIGNIYSHQYISLFPDPNNYGYHYIVEGAFTNYTNYVYWTLNPSTKTLQNYGDSSYYMYMDGSSSSGYYFTGSTSGDPITFYELVEEEITDGTVFYRTNELRVGDKVVIAHDNKALGNTTVSSDRFVDSVTVTHTVTGDESITVPNDKVSTVQWEVVSGDSTNGFVLKNVSNGKYLAIDSAEYLTVGTSQSTLWKYSGTDLTNNGSNYPYLKFNNEYVNFDTSSASGQDIRIYAASRKYNVTFMDGYNNTQIGAVQQVEEGGSAVAPEAPDHTAQGYVFTGWSAPYDNITEDTIVTAQYTNVSELSYTVTFHYRLSDGSWTDASQTVQHGHAATPPDAASVAPAGYTFNSWDKRYDNITSNLTINAVYKQEATKKYEITLRAVYGRANTTAKTHIFWFANNDESSARTGGQVQRMNEIGINQAVEIPTPDTFTYITGRETKTGLVWADHIFLGWARIDNETGANIAGDAHPELNEDNIFLAWDPTRGDYIVKQKIDGIDDVAIGQHVSKVAADETHPYHDMYAVWATVFYVYHSGTNQVEKIVRTTKDGKTYDLAHTTSNGYLYGGYYTEYKGMSTGFDPKATGFFQDVNVSWNSGALVRDASWNQSVKDAGTGAKAYNGSNAQWDGNEAYKAEDPEGNGLEMKPEAGKTYFIKEVPASMYLQPYLHYTYYKDSANGFPVANAWLISDVDDLCYHETGFIITHQSADGVHSARVAAQITIRPANGGNAVLLTPAKIFKAQGVEAGWLSYLAVINNNANQPSGWSNLLHDNDAVLRYWVTPDGLLVTGTVQSVYTGLAKVTTIGKTDTPVTSTIGEYTPNTL